MWGQLRHRGIDYSIVADLRIHVANGMRCDTVILQFATLFALLERFATAWYLLSTEVEDEE